MNSQGKKHITNSPREEKRKRKESDEELSSRRIRDIELAEGRSVRLILEHNGDRFRISEGTNPKISFEIFVRRMLCPIYELTKGHLGILLISMLLDYVEGLDRFNIIKKQIVCDLLARTTPLFRSMSIRSNYEVKSYPSSTCEYILGIYGRVFSRISHKIIFPKVIGEYEDIFDDRPDGTLGNMEDSGPTSDKKFNETHHPVIARSLIQERLTGSSLYNSVGRIGAVDFVFIIYQVIWAFFFCHRLKIRFEINIREAVIRTYKAHQTVYMGSDLLLETRMCLRMPFIYTESKTESKNRDIPSVARLGTNQEVYDIMRDTRDILCQFKAKNPCSPVINVHIFLVETIMANIKESSTILNLSDYNKVIYNFARHYAGDNCVPRMDTKDDETLYVKKTEESFLNTVEIEIGFFSHDHPLYLWWTRKKTECEDFNELIVLGDCIDEIKRISMHVPATKIEFHVKKELLKRYLKQAQCCLEKITRDIDSYSGLDTGDVIKKKIELKNIELYISRLNKNKLVKISPRGRAIKRPIISKKSDHQEGEWGGSFRNKTDAVPSSDASLDSSRDTGLGNYLEVYLDKEKQK